MKLQLYLGILQADSPLLNNGFQLRHDHCMGSRKGCMEDPQQDWITHKGYSVANPIGISSHNLSYVHM